MDTMDPNQEINVEFIQQKLDEGYHYTEETKGRDLILVIGNTGVGKSTTCNYLYGYRMKEVKYDLKPVIETVDETAFKIGHDVKSETLYAKSIVVDGICTSGDVENSNRVCLLDCPGFLGNRNIETKVIESISTELAIRSARQVKGILILISYNVLMETRLKELRELVKILLFLFKDPIEMVKYSVFVITKKHKCIPENEASDVVIGALRSLKKHCENEAVQLRKNPDLLSSEGLIWSDYEHIVTYFSAVLEGKDNILFINPLDNGESRKLIFSWINNIKPRKDISKALAIDVGIEAELQIRPITINDFNFSERNEDRDKCNKALHRRAKEGIQLISNIQKCRQANVDLNSEIVNCCMELSASIQGKLQQYLEEEIESKLSNKHLESVKRIEEMIVKNSETIESKKTDVDVTDVQIKGLSENLKSIDTDTPLLFKEKSVYRECIAWLTWEELDFEADTEDRTVEIVEVVKSMKNGNWVKEHDKREHGIYKTRYESVFNAMPAEAYVKVYIKTKDEKGNKIKIANMKKELNRLMEHQKYLKSELQDLESEKKSLQANLSQAKEDLEAYKNTQNQNLRDCVREIEKFNAEIIRIGEEIKQATISEEEYLQNLKKNRHKFDIVLAIGTLLEFPPGLIIDFISQYKEFLPSYKGKISEDIQNAQEGVDIKRNGTVTV